MVFFVLGGFWGLRVPVLVQVVKIDEGRIEAHLTEVVRATMEEMLNAFLMPKLITGVQCQEVRAQRAARTPVPATTATISWP
jgi:hypothetical protein